MREYLDIFLDDLRVEAQTVTGEGLIKAGRYLIAEKLTDMNVATADPLGAENPLIFSAGPLAGTTFSNANRTSVGCKSPLTGGIKEANAGGTFSYALGRLEKCGFTLHGQAADWTVIHFHLDGTITFDDAGPYMGLPNTAVSDLLYERYGKKIAYALIGPVGEYLGLLAGITISDSDRRPSRLAARGGVGAVMGSKKVKAIVIDLAKMPQLHDRKKTLAGGRDYAKMINQSPPIQNVYKPIGTMAMADYTNHIGGLPVNNFTAGTQDNFSAAGDFQMGGSHISQLNTGRGGNHSHACMPGCVIQCSNVYVDDDGNEVTSPVEYETLALLGTNCGLTDPDDLARMNQHCNELGIDTIETGAMIAVLMDAGLAAFGDVAFMEHVFAELLAGSEQGKLWAQGTYRVGKHYGIHRIPTVKKQAISAYDPRVIEITGVTMMVSAQGADHTAGNVPKTKSRDKSIDEIMRLSMEAQIACAAADSIGLCVFGRSVTNPNVAFMADILNAATGANVAPTFFHEIGRAVIQLEHQFNIAAGFTTADDDLPQFFYDEPLQPTAHVARFRGEDVKAIIDLVDEVSAQDVPEQYGRVV